LFKTITPLVTDPPAAVVTATAWDVETVVVATVVVTTDVADVRVTTFHGCVAVSSAATSINVASCELEYEDDSEFVPVGCDLADTRLEVTASGFEVKQAATKLSDARLVDT